jgi:hypothetical protein
MAIEMNITSTTSAAKAERIAASLRGQTYMNLYVNVCPINGMHAVNVGTLRSETTREELTEMVLDLMASMIGC